MQNNNNINWKLLFTCIIFYFSKLHKFILPGRIVLGEIINFKRDNYSNKYNIMIAIICIFFVHDHQNETTINHKTLYYSPGPIDI